MATLRRIKGVVGASQTDLDRGSFAILFSVADLAEVPLAPSVELIVPRDSDRVVLTAFDHL